MLSSTLNFKDLSIMNFMSFGNAPVVIDLSEQGTIEVIGQNLDKTGSNGSGKCVYPETKVNVRLHGVEHHLTMTELYNIAVKMNGRKE